MFHSKQKYLKTVSWHVEQLDQDTVYKQLAMEISLYSVKVLISFLINIDEARPGPHKKKLPAWLVSAVAHLLKLSPCGRTSLFLEFIWIK